MKKVILVGLAGFVLGVIIGCFFSPNRYELSYAPRQNLGLYGCFKIDTLTGKVWRYNPEKATFYLTSTEF